jgi:hypothetical protein
MNWAQITKKSVDIEVTKLKKKTTKLKRHKIDLYPEDLFDIRHSNDIYLLKMDMEKEIQLRGVKMLNHKFSFEKLYQFVLYNTNLTNIEDELINEEPEEEEETSYYHQQNKNIVFNKDG